MHENISTSTQIYSVFRPIFLLTRICCFLPIKIRHFDAFITVEWSWKYYLLSLAGFAGIVSSILFGLIKSYQIDDVYDVRLKQFSGKFITILDDSYLLLTFVLATISVPFTFKHYCEYMKYINEADTFLKYRGFGAKKKCHWVFSLTLILTTGVLCIDITVWGKFYTKHITGLVYLLYAIPFYFTYIVVIVIELNYWYLVTMINVRLKYLINSMTEMYVRAKKNGNHLNGLCLKKQKGVILLTKHDVCCIKAYGYLFEAATSVNGYYGLNILMVIIGCSIHLLVTPYDLYLETKYHDQTFIFPQICWMALHVFRLLLVVEPCHAASQHVISASTLLYTFLLLDLKETVHIQVEAFAVKLVHCPIQFTAFDLFTLNRSLLTAIAGGVTTYLVILFQFKENT